jgi:hypothetical protein
MCGEVEKTWEAVVVAYLKVIFRFLRLVTEKTTKITPKTVSPVDTRYSITLEYPVDTRYSITLEYKSGLPPLRLTFG